MTTLVLQTAGAAFGSVLGPFGASVGRVLGGLAGSAIDARLFGSSGGTRHVEGPRLKEMDGLASTEGAPIPHVYGRVRIGGQLIWATRFEEQVNTSVTRAAKRGAKGGGSQGSKTVTTTYSYSVNLAIGLCEGPVSFVRRIWADGRELDLSQLTFRVYQGTETQSPDPLIIAKEGAGNAPGYRGLAYIVFERLPLAEFGNRIPQFSFEVVRAVGTLAPQIQSVCLIPGASEFALDPVTVTRTVGAGVTRPDNRNQLTHASDVLASLDALQALCPNLQHVSLVVSWFGDDLRAGSCTISPRVERSDKPTYGSEWNVAGLSRAEARLVSLVNNAPAYGGTPSDASVIRLIQEIKARGLNVTFYPFVMIDVPAGNTLPNPWTGTAGQPAYPWRGRMTGTSDADIDALFGAASASDFSVTGQAVSYTGLQEWTIRRHILHCAALCKAAGGVEAFIIGSEMVALTRLKVNGSFPAVEAYCALAAQVRLLLPASKLTYAADWTEYGAQVLGSDVWFPLDALWAHSAIDAVGIDFYAPLSDWRDGSDHLDSGQARTLYDRNYLKKNLHSGEAYDWFYGSSQDRVSQTRTPISDGAYNKPWIYRPKDVLNWWSNAHIQRVNGLETTATSWVPQSKPVWLTEIGVPAVDKGTNGPNVFPDPKSSESAYPHFSSGARDDLIQVKGLEAILAGYEGLHNPVSSVYQAPMLDTSRMSIWAWDARPYPAFPDFSLVWADSANWETGHWLTGRLEGMSLQALIKAVLVDYGIDVPVICEADGFLDGFSIDRPMSARGALEVVTRLYGADVIARAGTLVWRGRGGREVIALSSDDLAQDSNAPLLNLTRAQETELPRQIELGFMEGEVDFRQATVASQRLTSGSQREEKTQTSAVLPRGSAQALVDMYLQDIWAGRETATFSLSTRRLEIEPGDLVSLPLSTGPALHRVTKVTHGALRHFESRAVEPEVFAKPIIQPTRPFRQGLKLPGQAAVFVMDLPAATEPLALQSIAGFANPWPGALAVWRSADGISFALQTTLDIPAQIGVTLNALPPGPLWRWHRATLDVKMSSGVLSAVEEGAALSGANRFALQGADGRWEIIIAQKAELIGEQTYRLSKFLRGLAGSEPEALRSAPIGSRLVWLDEAVVPLTASLDDLGVDYIYRIGPITRDYADGSYVELRTHAKGEGLKPYSPVHVKARRLGTGVQLSWVRRTRLNGDGWEALDVPLNEERELYHVEIMNAGDVVASFDVSEPFCMYPAAHEISDFGSEQTSLHVRVSQTSAVLGAGFVRDEVVEVGR